MFLDFFVHTAQAATMSVPLEVGIGSLGIITSEWPLIDYIKAVYTFISGSIGIIAAVMIMLNGLRWASAAGNSEQISTAKTGITGAVVGLILALSSYVILTTINPKLTTLNPLSMETLTFVEPVTKSEAAMTTGDITKDENLVNFQQQLPADLQTYMEVKSGVIPNITSTAYTALEKALTTLKNDSANSSSEYYGMKLRISSANRTLDTQQRYWACYQKYPPNGGTPCPAGCQNTGGSGCNVAAPPGTSRHGYGNALDVTWINTGPGKYETNYSHASSTDHNNCLVATNSTASWCTQSFKDSVKALDTLMQDSGFSRICIEWWHFQVGATSSPDSLCAPGSYKSGT